ncbi:MAG: phosphoribosylamine--glycine ligase [Hyphomicrobiales bacterium]
MNVFLIGHGGREHALGWKLAQSPMLTTLWSTGSNPALSAISKPSNVDAADHPSVVQFCKANQIELVVVGPEAPLVAGLVDDLQAAGIAAFGPSKAAAQLEGSKYFTKAVCDEAKIPTAGFGHFSNLNDAKAYLGETGAPIVIKADGLAAGKGVTVAMTMDEANSALEDCFAGHFGDAGASVVIEEFLNGEEASIFVLCDGENMLTLASAQDHKRVGDGDIGPNTGGMGAYSPAPVVKESVLQQTLDQIIAPTLKTLSDRGTPYRGVLYAGLMINEEGPKLIEYNCRFGDPECQVLMMRMKSDLLPLLLASATGSLKDAHIDWHDAAALTVVLASNGYPGAYKKGTIISGLDKLSDADDVVVFHAGTKQDGANIVSDGGRVLTVTALGDTISQAQSAAYKAVESIDWPEGFCRKDIGWRAV